MLNAVEIVNLFIASLFILAMYSSMHLFAPTGTCTQEKLHCLMCCAMVIDNYEKNGGSRVSSLL